MIRVGVTGGIGSGKTTLCKEWEKLGAFVVYADDLAKKLMVEDEELVKKIKSTFGDKAYDEYGSLNRQYLAQEAFEKGRVNELNNLVHPVLWKKVEEIADQKEKEGLGVFVKEAAILLQNGRPDDLDFVVLVEAKEKARVDRVIKRDNSDRNKIENRISAQQDFSGLTDLVDFIINNDEGVNELKSKAEVLLKEIRKF
ncbi:MAG TPA: dephospho-CoA kinase [Balneola sp.]|jgi:dephospho-CoA kinase|nr:dephospho-CoA kinase [Balneola sp.]MAO77672.1 dephospho-CoA kinase [Balneola sp.]MBF63990.1 dephospho-CoA kinase [Balneola sp.]HAH51829.1 dephospho-CoA kinase [Balneola sp.]HBZ37116.1 dephospho-CoA kinase [Balneola sp.]|tara:strand:- start:4005 stop:4598 length:594 start_codon:yes stop_codon:yes gene_type:complete